MKATLKPENSSLQFFVITPAALTNQHAQLFKGWVQCFSILLQ